MACLSRKERERKRKRRILKMVKCYEALKLMRTWRSRRSCWTRSWLLRRDEAGAYNTLISEFQASDHGSFLNFMRMNPNLFEDILQKIHPYIARQDTRMRKAVTPGVRLAITLRFLATGDSYKSLSYLFRVGSNTIGKIVPQVCDAIYKVLRKDHLKCPQSEAEWLEVSDAFWHRWQFPNCLGSVDGKHVAVFKPCCSGATYFNYKHYFSVVLMAVVDANYKFIFIEAGAQGRISDGGVYHGTSFREAIERNTLGIPQPKPYPGTVTPKPFAIIGDEAFPLRENLLKPYPFRNLSVEQRVYNYRLSRARRCVENAFGILASRFRVFSRPMVIQPEKVIKVVMATCCLHNMLRGISKDDSQMQTTGEVEKSQLKSLTISSRRSATERAKGNRDDLRDYFMSEEGEVPWQYESINHM